MTNKLIYNPFSKFSTIFNSDFDSMFMPLSYRTDSTQTNVADIPRANVYKNDEGYSIELAAPGFSRDDFEMSVENGTLSIYVETEDGKEEAKNIRRREWSYSSFTRSFALPETTNIENISARYEAGILHVQIPVEKERNTRRMIAVE
tara:strand:+ start:3214 stop:3654 length:441 start_codon:yes stop_codon:yes gene_type:complete